MIFKAYNNTCPNNDVYFMQGLLLHIWQIKKPHQTSVSDFMHSAKLTLLLSEMWPPYASNSMNLWKVLRTKVITCFLECLLQLFCGFSLSCLFMLSRMTPWCWGLYGGHAICCRLFSLPNLHESDYMLRIAITLHKLIWGSIKPINRDR